MVNVTPAPNLGGLQRNSLSLLLHFALIAFPLTPARRSETLPERAATFMLTAFLRGERRQRSQQMFL